MATTIYISWFTLPLFRADSSDSWIMRRSILPWISLGAYNGYLPVDVFTLCTVCQLGIPMHFYACGSLILPHNIPHNKLTVFSDLIMRPLQMYYVFYHGLSSK